MSQSEAGWRWSAPQAITQGPGHHFFGYYGIPPWNASERLYACLESDFHDRMPQPGERAQVGVVDLASGAFERLTTTAAWNLQQGAMIHWLPTLPDRQLIFNDLDAEAGAFRPVIVDVTTGHRRVIDSPYGIGAVSPDGREALGLDYARLHTQRPVVGYAGGRDRTEGALCPEDDGVWRIDVATGRTELVLSHAQAVAATDPPPLARERPLFFNHTLYNPAGTRFMVFLRYFGDGGRLDSAVLTARPDGSDVRCLVPWGTAPSHFDWLSERELLVTVSHPTAGRRYLMLEDTPEAGWASPRQLGDPENGVLCAEGHPTFSPDRACFVFDGESGSAGEPEHRPVRLYDIESRREVVLAQLYNAPQFKGDVRCDPHPRWSRSGTQVSFDSVRAGDRQVYVIDLERSGQT